MRQALKGLFAAAFRLNPAALLQLVRRLLASPFTRRIFQTMRAALNDALRNGAIEALRSLIRWMSTGTPSEDTYDNAAWA